MPVSQMVYKFTFVIVSVRPEILSLTIGAIFSVLADISLSVLVALGAISVFIRVFKLTFISIAPFGYVYTKSFYLSVFPLSYVALSLATFPYSAAMFFSIRPFALIDFSINPFEDSFAIFGALLELTLIFGSIGKFLISVTLFQIILKLAFVKFSNVIENDTIAIFFVLVKLTKVNAVSIFFDLEMIQADHLKDFTFGSVFVGDPLSSFFIEIVSDWMDKFWVFYVVLANGSWHLEFCHFWKLHYFIYFLYFLKTLLFMLIVRFYLHFSGDGVWTLSILQIELVFFLIDSLQRWEMFCINKWLFIDWTDCLRLLRYDRQRYRYILWMYVVILRIQCTFFMGFPLLFLSLDKLICLLFFLIVLFVA